MSPGTRFDIMEPMERAVLNHRGCCQQYDRGDNQMMDIMNDAK
jgi:hypothetical protein